MKYKLFGNNISPNCNYCNNFIKTADRYECLKKREIKKGKCRKFDYNPTLRIPKAESRMMQFSKEDFEI